MTNMPLPRILPAMNTLWFWFPQATRRKLHGTLKDVERKFRLLNNAGFTTDGIEIYIEPERLAGADTFAPGIATELASLPQVNVHIGSARTDFLDEAETRDALSRLANLMGTINANTIILHAHHLQNSCLEKAELLRTTLPGVDVLVENNGFDNVWGAAPESIRSILEDCPDFHFCLDITHVEDFEQLELKDFMISPIQDRIKEIHWSYSTNLLDHDPYERIGFPGYGPFHALYSLVEPTPDPLAIQLTQQHPVVVEGVLPREDTSMAALKREFQLLGATI